LGKNGVQQKLGKLRKGSACLQRLITTVLDTFKHELTNYA